MTTDELLDLPLNLEPRIKSLLAKLPKQQYKCFILHYAYGYKYKEIAIRLGLTRRTVGFYVGLAKIKIKDNTVILP